MPIDRLSDPWEAERRVSIGQSGNDKDLFNDMPNISPMLRSKRS